MKNRTSMSVFFVVVFAECVGCVGMGKDTTDLWRQAVGTLEKRNESLTEMLRARDEEAARLRNEIEAGKKRIEDLSCTPVPDIKKEPEIKTKVEKMTITAYTLSKDECSESLIPAYPKIKSRAGHTASVSRDLRHLLGKEIYIEGFGKRIINDLTSERFTKRIDVLVASKSEARTIGRKQVLVHF